MTHEIEEGVMATAAMKAQAKCIDDGVQFASISFDLGFTAGYQAALPQWQDISTAPRDEEPVWVWKDGMSAPEFGSFYQVSQSYYEPSDEHEGLYVRMERRGFEFWGDCMSPTHWAPKDAFTLPLPPKEGEG